MPLTYNFGGLTVPNVNKRAYKYAGLTEIFTIKMTDNSGKETAIAINAKKAIGDAWKYIEASCAKRRECNAYFAQLAKKKTLADIMSAVTFTVHQLIPKEGFGEADLPFANSAGADFGLSALAFLNTNQTAPAPVQVLASTILHEIAHYAGASTDASGEHALDAEKSLLPCGLKKYYNPEATG